MKHRFSHRALTLALSFMLSMFVSANASATEHPTLIITKQSVSEMKAARDIYPSWDNTVLYFLNVTDALIAKPIDVPVPKDPAGGYTHSQHKTNAKAIKQSGIAYLLSRR